MTNHGKVNYGCTQGRRFVLVFLLMFYTSSCIWTKKGTWRTRSQHLHDLCLSRGGISQQHSDIGWVGFSGWQRSWIRQNPPLAVQCCVRGWGREGCRVCRTTMDDAIVYVNLTLQRLMFDQNTNTSKFTCSWTGPDEPKVRRLVRAARYLVHGFLGDRDQSRRFCLCRRVPTSGRLHTDLSKLITQQVRFVSAKADP